MPTNIIAKLRELIQGVRSANATAESNAAQLQGARDDTADFRKWTSEELAGTRDDIADFRKWVSEMFETIAADHETVRNVALAANNLAAHTTRRLGLRTNPTRVVFLVHNDAVWASLDELYLLMLGASDFDPIVVSIPQHYGGFGGARGEQHTHEALVELGISHLRLTDAAVDSADDLLRALDPDIVIRQSQWDKDVPEQFSTTSLAWTRPILVPYEMVNIVTNTVEDAAHTNTALDTAWHRACWLVFVANDEALQSAQRAPLLGGRQFRVAGHPKADYLRATQPHWPIKSDATAPRVLWSAHHSILSNWNDFGTFPAVCDEMLAWAISRPDVEFVFTYHPLLLETFAREQSPLTPEAFEAWLARWQDLPNTGVWHGYYAAPLAASDVVVTDSPSMMIEAQVAGKPIIWLDRAGHIAFNEAGQQFAQGAHHVTDVAGVVAAFNALQDGDPLAEVQRANAENAFGSPGAAERILATIRDEIARERAAVER